MRGRPPKPEAERRQQIGVRTSPALKSMLEASAGENGRSVAQEAELRLIASFDTEALRLMIREELRDVLGIIE